MSVTTCLSPQIAAIEYWKLKWLRRGRGNLWNQCYQTQQLNSEGESSSLLCLWVGQSTPGASLEPSNPQPAVLWAAPVGSELIYCSQVDGHMPSSTHPGCSFGCRLDGSAPAPCTAVPSCPSCTRLLADFPIVWGSGAAHSSPAAHVGGQAPFATEDTSSSISWREEPGGRRENEQFLYNSS